MNGEVHGEDGRDKRHKDQHHDQREGLHEVDDRASIHLFKLRLA